ncbi:MAG: 4-hydroxy-tetrahydrodipicolinate synthase [Candidatus Hodarchaeota archaeon]
MPLDVKGNIPALVTPFNRREEIDENALRELVEYLIEGKAHAIFTSGTVGSFYLMYPEERKKVGEIVVDQVNGRVPVYLGTGGIFAKETMQVIKYSIDIGADAAVVLTPYYIKVSDRELFDHFKTMVESVEIPIILYNNPPRAGINITPELLESLVSETDNIVAIKDSSANLVQFEEYIQRVGDRISIIMGVDELIFASLMVGGKGAVNAVGNIVPKIVTELHEEFKKGNIERARELQHDLLLLKRALLIATYPGPIMAALHLIGKPGGYPRKPVLAVTKEQEAVIKDALVAIGKL